MVKHNRIPSFLLGNSPAEGISGKSSPYTKRRKGLRASFVDKAMERLGRLFKAAYVQQDIAFRDGFFQGLDARVKLLFLVFFIVIVSLKEEVMPEVLIGLFIMSLVALSGLNLQRFYKRILLLAFLFGVLVALPSALNIIKEGEVIVPLFKLSREYKVWIFKIPETIGITKEGISGLTILTLRIINSLSLTFLVLYTTPLTEIIRALKAFKVPDTFLMVIALSYKYIFILAKTAQDIHLAKKSRMVRETDSSEARKWIAGRIAFLFTKTRSRYKDVFRAMLGRGFSGEVNIYYPVGMKGVDWITGFLLFSAGIVFLWI